MPHIYRTRYYVKYSGQKKTYENKIFTLANREQTDHALFTMINTGGKGVLLHATFQVMLPLISMENGKRIIGPFFHDHKGRFKPYTFYVLIEWKLDTPDERYLVAGIALTAKKNAGKEEQDDPFTFPYRLFTVVCSPESPYRLHRLPIYDEETKTSLPLEKWDDYTKEHNDIRTYSEKEKSRYYAALAEWGVSIDEWKEIHRMNQGEAGVGKLFEEKKAMTNDGLMRNLIVPAAVEDIEVEHQQLVEMFKSNAEIAKGIDELNERKDMYNTVIQNLITLSEALVPLSKVEQEAAELLQQGREWMGAYQHVLMETESTVDELEEAGRKLLDVRDDLRFKIDSIQCTELTEQLANTVSELEVLEKQLTSFEETEKECASEIKRWKLLIEKKKWHIRDNEIARLRFENQTLEEQAGLKEKARIKAKLQHRFHSLWEHAQQELSQSIVQAEGYLRSLESKKSEINTTLKKKQDEKEQEIRKQEGLLTNFKNWKQKKNIIAESYGIWEAEHPEEAVGQTKDQIRINDEESEQVRYDTKVAREREVSLSSSIASSVSTERSISEQIMKLTERIREKVAEETGILEQLSHFVTVPSETWSPALIQEQAQHVLAPLLQNNRSQLREASDLLQQLTKIKEGLEDKFSPNPHVIEIRNFYSSKGLQLFLGAEYLRQCTEEERETYVEENPLLPYSLLVKRQDLHKLKSQSFYYDKVLASPVPIFCIEEVRDCSLSLILAQTKTKDVIVREEAYQAYRREIEEKYEVAENEVSRLSSRIQRMEGIQDSIQRWSGSDHSAILNAKKESLCIQLETESMQLTKLRSALGETREQIAVLEEQAKKVQSHQQKLQAQLRDITEWVSDTAQSKVWTQELLECEQALKSLGKELSNFESLLGEFRQEENHITIEFKSWKQRITLELREFTPLLAVHLPSPAIGDTHYPFEPIFANLPDTLHRTFFEWSALHEELTQGAVQGKIQSNIGEIQVHQQELEELEKKLRLQDTDWTSYPSPQEGVEDLERKLERSESKLGDTFKRVTSVKAGISGSRSTRNHQETAVKQKKDQIWRTHRRMPEVVEDNDLDALIQLVIADLSDVDQRVQRNADDIAKSKDLKNHLEQQISFLKTEIREEEGARSPRQELIRLAEEIEVKGGNEWLRTRFQSTQTQQTLRKRYQELFQKQRSYIQDNHIWNSESRRQVVEAVYGQLSQQSPEQALNMCAAFQNHFKDLVHKDEENLIAKEQARERWIQAASEWTQSGINAIWSMFQSMKITNRGGYEFEMLKFRQFRKPKLEDIKPTMLGVFRQSLETYFESDEDDKKQRSIKDKLSPGNLVLAAFNRRFPEVLIYNMNTDNTFIYNAPLQERDYQSWESFINGKSLVFPSGSGGQIVAALSLVCMMLASHRGGGRKDRKTTIIMDNPFANAVSEHVLDPIFAVADMKNIQWVVVCPPELVKLGVSNRFPIYYAMSLKKSEAGRETVVDEVNYGMRMYERVAMG